MITSRCWRSPALIVTAAAALYALAVTYPLVTELDRAIYGYPGDATGTVAIYEFWRFALLHGQSLFNNNLWGAPYGAGWNAVPFAVLPLAVFTSLSAITGATAAYNVQVLTSFPLTAWTTYLLARQVGSRPVGAAFAALAFAFIPYHLEKAQGHVGQAHMEFFSAALYFLVRWRHGGNRWNLAGAGAVAGLTLWNDYYQAYILAVPIGCFFVLHAARRHPGIRWGTWLKQTVLAGVLVAAVAAAFVPIAVLAAARPGGGPSTAVSAQVRNVSEIQIYSSRPWDFVLPYYANPLVPSRVVKWETDHLHGSNFVEQSLFIGYTVGALALIAVFVGWKRFETILLLGVGAAGFLVSLPPTYRVAGMTVALPSAVLGPIFPVFRVYSRFGLLVLLGATVLAGLGLTWLQPRLGRFSAPLFGVLFVMAAIEFTNVPPSHVTQIFPAPGEYRWLAAQPAGILVEYPLKAGQLQDQEIETRQYTLYQQTHGHPIFNGAVPGSRADDISSELEPYYFPGVGQRLHDIGIRYVFVHRADYERDGFDLPQNVPGLSYVTTIDGTDIYTVPQT